MTGQILINAIRRRAEILCKATNEHKDAFVKDNQGQISIAKISSPTRVRRVVDSNRTSENLTKNPGEWYTLAKNYPILTKKIPNNAKTEWFVKALQEESDWQSEEVQGYSNVTHTQHFQDYANEHPSDLISSRVYTRQLIALPPDWNDAGKSAEMTLAPNKGSNMCFILGTISPQPLLMGKSLNELQQLVLLYDENSRNLANESLSNRKEDLISKREELFKKIQEKHRSLEDSEDLRSVSNRRRQSFYKGGDLLQMYIPKGEIEQQNILDLEIIQQEDFRSWDEYDLSLMHPAPIGMLIELPYEMPPSSDKLDRLKRMELFVNLIRDFWGISPLMDPHSVKANRTRPSIDTVQNISYHLSLSGETYSLLEIPSESSQAVIAGKEAILENLRLDNLVTGLERASSLVHVAQNGVAGFGSLMAAMTGLGDGIISAAADASLTLSGFSDDSEAILRSLKRAMDFLLKGREKLAVKYFAKCAKSAQEMSTESAKLADRFDELGDQTIEVLKDTQVTQSRQHEKIADERRKIAELTANNAAAQTLQQELATQQAQLKSMYQEAKKQQEKAENRAFAMQIVGAITGALGAGLNTVVGGIGRSTPAPAPAPTPVPVPVPTPVKESPAPAPTTETETETETENGRTSETEGSDASAKQSTKEAEAAIQGVAAASTATAQRTVTMASSQQTAGQSYRDEKMKYLDKLLEVEANQRKALADIAKYAELLKSSAEEKEIAETTAAALHQAVGALKSIAATLRDNAFFWQLMTRACEKLAEPDFLEFIEDISDLPFEERLELYLEDDFKVEIVTYYAQWQALKLVCDEYSAAVFEARDKMMADFQQNPTIEAAQKQAPVLAGQLLAETQADLQALDARTAAIQAEQAAIEVNAEAVV